MAETKQRKRGANRPLNVRLSEAIDTEKKRVEYHEKHLKEARAGLQKAEADLKAYEEEEAKTANEKIAEYERELARLKNLIKK